MIARVPPADIALPTLVRRLAAGRRVRPIWRNELGGLTVAVDDDPPVVVKWVPPAQRTELLDEVERLRWAAPRTSVPRVIDHGVDDDTGAAWMTTDLIPGTSAVDARWLADPEPAIRAIGSGLRALHDSLPLAECPFTWSLGDRRADAHHRADAGLVDPSRWHDDHRHLTVAVLRRCP